MTLIRDLKVNDDLKSLGSFINEVEKHITIKEPTLFAVGGRGHYENPASDLLAFFFRPNGEHGLGNLFFSTYLECIEQQPRQFMDVVSVEREVVIEGGRIDLEILGKDWCLIIENKIRHKPFNPFGNYEAHADKSGKGKKLFSILSPHKTDLPEGSATTGRWKPVFYKDYCQKLRERMATKFFDAPFSKWHIFAREFILHMENELYNPPMKPEDAKFVEEHAAEFIQARSLLEQYPAYLGQVVEEMVEKELGYEIEVKQGWAIFIRSPKNQGNAAIWLCYQTNDYGYPIISTDGFDIRVYPDEGELKRGQSNADQSNLPKGMRGMRDENGYYWATEKSFKDRDEAIKFTIPLIKLIERPPA